MSKKKKNASSAQRTALTVLCVVLGLVLVIMLAGTVYVEYLMNKMNYVSMEETQPRLSQEEADQYAEEDETLDPDYTGPDLNEEDVDLDYSPDVKIGGEDIVNILLIGQDTRVEGERARSDSMILVTFNKEKNTITMTSFMRDMYVKIPGYKKNRINAAYYFGGMSLLDETLEENFGIHVDGNVEVDFTHFTEIIDLLGGVTVELNKQEASFVNLKSGSSLSSGVNRLTGIQALWYARNRSDAAGDFNRTSRQRVVLNALIDEYKNAKLTTMVGMLDDILPMITTDLTKKEITNYVVDLFPMLASAEIVTQRIPVDGGYYDARIDGMAVLVPDLAKNTQALVDSLT